MRDLSDDTLGALSLGELKTLLSEIRAERMATQRTAGRRDAAQLALTSAERDEASVVSDELTTLRGRAQRLHDAVLDMWLTIDARITNCERLCRRSPAATDADRGALATLEQDAKANRAAAHQQIGDLGLIVPGIREL